MRHLQTSSQTNRLAKGEPSALVKRYFGTDGNQLRNLPAASHRLTNAAIVRTS